MKMPIWIRKILSPTPRVGDKVRGSLGYSVWLSGTVIERSGYPVEDTIFYKVDATVRIDNCWTGLSERREIVTVNRLEIQLC